jgi:hypothetical protein
LVILFILGPSQQKHPAPIPISGASRHNMIKSCRLQEI